MNGDTKAFNVEDYALFLKSKSGDLNRLLGFSLYHKVYGEGEIAEVTDGRVIIRFMNDRVGSKTFNLDSLCGAYFRTINVPIDQCIPEVDKFIMDLNNEREHKEQLRIELEQMEKLRIAESQLRIEKEYQERKIREKLRIAKEEQDRKAREELRIINEVQEKKEAEAVKEFAELRRKYYINTKAQVRPTSPLYMILLKIEKNESLIDEELKWLEEIHEYQFVAKYFLREYQHNGDLWQLVKACRCLRKASVSAKVIELLGDKKSTDHKLMSAILNVLGAAYRDLAQMDLAEDSAQKAIKENDTSCYPYNLMGAILYQKGMPAEGDKYFEKAVLLGSTLRNMDSEIKKSLMNADGIERKIIAEYLLDKDPKKYDWAKSYLHN